MPDNEYLDPEDTLTDAERSLWNRTLSSGTFYHGSPGKNEKSILSKGLDAKRGSDRLVWVSKDPEYAYYETQDELGSQDDDWLEKLEDKGIIVFKIKLPSAAGIKIKYSSSEYEDTGYSVKPIPAKYISVHKRLGPDQAYEE